MIASAGPAILLAAWSVQYRDVKHAMTFLVQILLYASPVVYSISIIPEQYRLVYAINPMVGVIEGFRASVLGTSPMPWDTLGLGLGMSLLILLLALVSFATLEKTFADVA